MAKITPADVESTEAYDPLTCTHTALRVASRQLTQLYDDALAASGLTSGQALLVARIDELGGAPSGTGPSLQALAKRLSIQISALTHALRPLVRDGLVEVVVDANDRRVKRAVLTEQGLKQTRQMYVLWQELNERIDAVLGEGTTEQLRGLANLVAAPGFAQKVLARPE
ncbi:MarR family transcriptional regulator [Devosia sp.]|uniref:MarR family winged helix-turn-helix transcriptional regulator n=1 Tax=Devosia sp. TaxID=1871048 RepID=UPI0025CC73E8|nr:MarR family transcriptional regulator [Devosia sp.]MCR6633343.1 MarR family transcriptional regulator [Devosia sp.]